MPMVEKPDCLRGKWLPYDPVTHKHMLKRNENICLQKISLQMLSNLIAKSTRWKELEYSFTEQWINECGKYI